MRLLLQRPKGRPLRTARGQGTKDVMIRFREVILLLALLFLGGCAAGPNAVANTPGETGTVAGFWLGLWHACIWPITQLCLNYGKRIYSWEVGLSIGGIEVSGKLYTGRSSNTSAPNWRTVPSERIENIINVTATESIAY